MTRCETAYIYQYNILRMIGKTRNWNLTYSFQMYEAICLKTGNFACKISIFYTFDMSCTKSLIIIGVVQGRSIFEGLYFKLVLLPEEELKEFLIQRMRAVFIALVGTASVHMQVQRLFQKVTAVQICSQPGLGIEQMEIAIYKYINVLKRHQLIRRAAASWASFRSGGSRLPRRVSERCCMPFRVF